MEENRQAIIEMISRTKDNKRMSALIKQYMHLCNSRTPLAMALVNLVNDIIEYERKEDNKMGDINFNKIFNVHDVKIEYNADDLIFHAKTLFLMSGLTKKDTVTADLTDVLTSISEKLSNDIKVTGIDANASLVADIKSFIILSLYRVILYDFIKFSLDKNSIETTQILNILDLESTNKWKGARLSE